jgi:hypothetical protein
MAWFGISGKQAIGTEKYKVVEAQGVLRRFDDFIKSGDVRTAKNSAENAFKIIENVYDFFLSFIEALLAKGFKSYFHEANINLTKFYPNSFSIPKDTKYHSMLTAEEAREGVS